MNEAGELRERLDVFFESLLSSLPEGGSGPSSNPVRDLKESLFGLCKLDGPDDEERVKAALVHTHQVAEAMAVMTAGEEWERLSEGELFKHLVREVEEESPQGSADDKVVKLKEFLSPVQEAARAVAPYQMTFAYMHDLGKLRTRREHEFASAEMIAGEGLMELLRVPQDQALVMEAAIKYHLILPSVFTGSYSLLNFIPVKEDPLVKRIEEEGLTERFFDALYLISVADVAGLGKMTRIKIDNFDLRASLKSAFSLGGSEFRRRLYELDRERVMVRLASLRCFNKMELKQDDLRRYMGYAEEARDALLTMDKFGVREEEWGEFLDFLPRLASFGYSIGFLYTFGATGEDGVPGSQKKISPRLFGLLVELSRLMRRVEDEEGWSNALWEIAFHNHPGFWDDEFKKLMAWMVRDGSLEELLAPERVSHSEKNGLKVLEVDFSGLPPA